MSEYPLYIIVTDSIFPNLGDIIILPGTLLEFVEKGKKIAGNPGQDEIWYRVLETPYSGIPKQTAGGFFPVMISEECPIKKSDLNSKAQVHTRDQN